MRGGVTVSSRHDARLQDPPERGGGRPWAVEAGDGFLGPAGARRKRPSVSRGGVTIRVPAPERGESDGASRGSKFQLAWI